MSPFIHTVPLQAMLDEARREVSMRERVYWGLVRNGKLSRAHADKQMATMRGICDLIEHVMRDHGETPLPEPRDRQRTML